MKSGENTLLNDYFVENTFFLLINHDATDSNRVLELQPKIVNNICLDIDFKSVNEDELMPQLEEYCEKFKEVVKKLEDELPTIH